MVISENVGGNNIYFSALKNQLYLINSKKGTISIFDIRKNSILKTVGGDGDIKCSLLNNAQNTLIIGKSDAGVRLYDLDNYDIITEFYPFKQESSKFLYLSNFIFEFYRKKKFYNH